MSDLSKTQAKHSELPPIPDKRYFNMGEASFLCGVKAHVLRYWEQEFPQLNPHKRRGNRRYYQYEDLLIARQIRCLLYEKGYTIMGAKQCLAGETVPDRKAEKLTTALQQSITDLEAALRILTA